MNLPKQLINGFIEAELNEFKKLVNEALVPDVQDIRSLSIAWLCYYFRESISHENRNKIVKFVDRANNSSNYKSRLWYRVSALQAAAFILTTKIEYANALLRHISCGQGWARAFILQSAGIICPRLSFRNEILEIVTERNMEFLHFYYKENIALYLFTKGTADEKLQWINYQIKINKREEQIKFLEGLKSYSCTFETGLFLQIFSRIKSYIIFKIFSNPELVEVQPMLFDKVERDYITIERLEENHPLSTYYLDFSFLEKRAE